VDCRLAERLKNDTLSLVKQKNKNSKKPTLFKADAKRVFIYLVVVGALVLIYGQFDELVKIKNILANIQYRWIALMLILEIFYFYSAARNYYHILKIKGETVPVSVLLPISVIVQFINQVLPSANVSGQTFFVYQLRKYDIPIKKSVGRAFLEIVILNITIAVFFVIAISIMWWQGLFHQYPPLYALVAWFLIFAIPIIVIFTKTQSLHSNSMILRKIRSTLKKIIEKMRNSKWLDINEEEADLTVTESIEDIRATLNVKTIRNNSLQFITATLWQIMEFLLHATLFYVAAQALGVPISPVTTFVVFTATKFISMTAYIPSGIGLFEVLSTALLTAYGIELSASITITLLVRAFTFWLPMPAGWIMYEKFIKNIKTLKIQKEES